MFASKNSVGDSALDGLGMGIGFTIALLCMGTIREVFGAGTFCGYAIPVVKDFVISFFTQAPGGFFVFGVLIAIVNKLTKGKGVKKTEFGCEGCPSRSSCHAESCEAVEEGK